MSIGFIGKVESEKYDIFNIKHLNKIAPILHCSLKRFSHKEADLKVLEKRLLKLMNKYFLNAFF